MKNELLDLIYQFYPKGMYDSEFGYNETREFKNRQNACLIAEKNNFKWLLFVEYLKKIFPDFEVEDTSQLFYYDPCYRLRIYLPKEDELYKELVVMISVISPVYVIYLSEKKFHSGEFSIPNITFFSDKDFFYKDYYDIIRKKIEDTFGYYEMPLDLINEVVPEIAVGNKLINETSVLNCLFTDHIW